MKTIEIPNFLTAKEGVTATAANYAANMAKEAYQELDAKTRVQFIRETAETFNGKTLITKKGTTPEEVQAIPEHLHQMAKYKSLIAYLREAIKAKEALTEAVRNSKDEDWVETPEPLVLSQFEEPAPTAPANPILWSKEDTMDQWPLERKVRYLTLETKVTNLGKLIHEDGQYNQARKKLANAIAEPSRVDGMGTNIVVYTKESSVSTKLIDSIFFSMQQEWRELQKEFNSIQHDLEMEMQNHNDTAAAEYKKAFDKHNMEMVAWRDRRSDFFQQQHDIEQKYYEDLNALRLEAAKLREQKLHEVQGLKIVLPDNLKALYNEVSSQGK